MLDLPPVPEATADVVRRAATAVPARSSDLDELRRRYKRRHRRRMAVATSLAAVCVGVAVAGGPLLLDAPTGPSPAGPVLNSPAQRMMLAFTGATMSFPDGPDVGVMPGAKGVPELLADGRVHYHPLSDMERVHQAVALPDGRLVLTVSVDPELNLVILRADGIAELSHNLLTKGNLVSLVGATDQLAYLLRPEGLFARDFATGSERLVLDSIRYPNSVPPAAQGVAFAAGRLAVITEQPETCVVQVFDLTSAQRVAEVGLTALGCFKAEQVAVSPDGSLVAVTYGAQSADGLPSEERLAILDVATGAVRLDRPFSSYYRQSPLPSRILQGMAWHDSHTLRLAVAQLPAGANRMYRVEEILVVDTVTVPNG
jgi:hypothetical protein